MNNMMTILILCSTFFIAKSNFAADLNTDTSDSECSDFDSESSDSLEKRTFDKFFSRCNLDKFADPSGLPLQALKIFSENDCIEYYKEKLGMSIRGFVSFPFVDGYSDFLRERLSYVKDRCVAMLMFRNKSDNNEVPQEIWDLLIGAIIYSKINEPTWK